MPKKDPSEIAPWIDPATGRPSRPLTEEEKATQLGANTFPRKASWDTADPNRASCMAALYKYRSNSAKYQTAEELAEQVDAYIEWCATRELDTFDKKSGETVKYKKHRPFTFAGLSAFLSFKDVKGFTDQADRGDDFAFVVQHTRLRFEAYLNEKLIDNTAIPGGIIFALKNTHGWTDQAQVNISASVNVSGGLTMMPPEPKDMIEWQKWYKEVMGARVEEREKEAIDVTPEPNQLPAAKEAEYAEPA